ncbi:MAG: hypothetical protein HOP10_07075 [Chitinophagaceae bacterium]|nr:hypothetical protein [Chitinophagaceae bacterium]
MKKLFFYLFSAVCLAINSQAQENKTAPPEISHPCPLGMCVSSAMFHIDLFNFHKPRTECKSGFGFCVKGHWEYSCGFYPNCVGTINTGKAAKIENGKAFCWFNIVDGKLELHIPLELEKLEEYQDVDFSVFTIDTDMIFLKNDQGKVVAKAKEGDYPVKKTEEEFVIIIDLE